MIALRHWLLPLAVVAFLNGIPVQALKKRFGEVLPLTLCTIPLVMYVTQFAFGTFHVATVSLFALSVVSALVLFIRKRDVDSFFCDGLIAFLVCGLLFVIIDFHRTLTDFDEFWHWGPMVKESLRLDKFFCVNESRMTVHKDYPPFPALIEVFWVRIAGIYQEGIASAGLHTFYLSLLIAPLCEKSIVVKRPWPHVVVWSASACITALVLVGVLDPMHVTITLLADIPLALAFAFGLFYIMSGDAYDSILGIAITVLVGTLVTMTKQAGIAMLMTMALLYTVLMIVNSQRGHISRRSMCGLLVLVLLPLLVYISWSAYTKSIGFVDVRSSEAGAGQFELSNIDPHVYLNALFRHSDGLQQDTLWNLVRALFERNISSVPWASISYVSALALAGGLLVLLATRFRESFSTRKAVGIGSALLMSSAGYAFMLSVLFLFCFTTDEMQELRGYERYVGAFVIGVVLSLTMMLVTLLEQKRRLSARPHAFALIALCSIVLYGTNCIYLAPQCLREEHAKEYHQIANYAIQKTEPDSCICLVSNPSIHGGWYGFAQAHVLYYANDRDFPWGFNFFGADYTNEDVRTQALNKLSEIDYLYVLQTDDALNEFMLPYNDGNPLVEGTVYRVTQHNDGPQLRAV